MVAGHRRTCSSSAISNGSSSPLGTPHQRRQTITAGAALRRGRRSSAGWGERRQLDPDSVKPPACPACVSGGEGLTRTDGDSNSPEGGALAIYPPGLAPGECAIWRLAREDEIPRWFAGRFPGHGDALRGCDRPGLAPPATTGAGATARIWCRSVPWLVARQLEARPEEIGAVRPRQAVRPRRVTVGPRNVLEGGAGIGGHGVLQPVPAGDR
jgi:hypothetical protein